MRGSGEGVSARALVMLFSVLISLLAGCGQGGGGGAQRADAGLATSASSGSVVLKIARSATKLPTQTQAVRATIVGTSISDTASFASGATEVTLALDSPTGPQTLRIEALDGTGTVIAAGTFPIVVSADVVNQVSINSDQIVPVGSPTPTPTPTPTVPHLAFSVEPPTPALSGLPIPLRVGVYDGSGALIKTYNGPVTLALSANPGGDTFAGSTVNATSGQADFPSVFLTQVARGYRLQATATGFVPADSQVFDVVRGGLEFITQPNPAQTANQVLQPNGVQVRVLDAATNATITSAVYSVQMGLNPATGNLTSTPVNTVNGIATFTNLRVQNPGTYNLVASIVGPTPLSQTSTAFSVVGGSTSVAAGGLFVLLKDGQGNYTIEGYDLVSLTRKVGPVGITGYTPVGMSVRPNTSPPQLAVLGTDNNLRMYNSADLSFQIVYALQGTRYVPQVIKRDPDRDVFYITATDTATSGSGINDIVEALDLTSAPQAFGFTFNGVSQGGIHGLAVDPVNASFLVAQGGTLGGGSVGSASLSGPPVTVTFNGSQSVPQFDAGSDSADDIASIGGQRVGISVWGSGVVTPNGYPRVWQASSGVIDNALSPFSSFGPNSATDFRKDVRFYQSNLTQASALIANQTRNCVEVATVDFSTARAGAKILGTVSDVGASIFMPDRISLAMDSSSNFSRAYICSANDGKISVVDLSTLSVQSAIALAGGQVVVGSTVIQPGLRITGQ